MMKRLGLVLFMVCLCMVLFQKSELQAFFRDDIDPKKTAEMVKEKREQSAFRLERLKLEEKLKAEQEAAAPAEITRENRQETVTGPSSALKQTEKKTSIKKIINLMSIILIVISVIVYIIFLRRGKRLPV
ncbi:MAG: hypothetical protein KAX15_08030 [Candidatus Omnitrophica bacterium]|nr:hypothetical protein [Candidatus Omnitrophota bacterium]